MSFRVAVFHVSSPCTPEQLFAQAHAYDETLDEPVEPPVAEASPKVDEFLQELNVRYITAEQVSRLPEADRWQCPWAGSIGVMDGMVEIPMSGGTPDEAYELVVTLAKKHDLVCIGSDDNDLIHVPPHLLIGPPTNAKRWWQFWR